MRTFLNYREPDGVVHAPTVYPPAKPLEEPYEGVNVLCSVYIRVDYCDATDDAVTCLACIAKRGAL